VGVFFDISLNQEDGVDLGVFNDLYEVDYDPLVLDGICDQPTL
jgi:hypothetical protein